MSAGGWQVNDVPHLVGPFPLHGERVGPLDAFKESMRAHSPSNRERSQVVSEIEKTIPKLQLRNVFTDVNGIFANGLTQRHNVHPSHKLLPYPEQLEKRPRPPILGKGLTALIRGFRPAAGSLRRSEPVTSDNGIPANDNWPSEAA